MFALGVGQHQRAGNAFQHTGGRCPAASLFQPYVPRRADIRALGHFLAAQARRSAVPRKPKLAASSRVRRLFRNSPSDVGKLTGMGILLPLLP